jgi:hypothetical protein
MARVFDHLESQLHSLPSSYRLIQVLLFYLVSLLNSAAFACRIAMAVHIIFRSRGLIVSRWLVSNKRFVFNYYLHRTFVTLLL